MDDLYRHLDPSRLTPGELDAYAEDALLRGACMGLAIALHDRTGWPIMAVTEAYNVYDGRAGGGSAAHWMVRRPDGMLIDVLGAHTEEDVLWEYDNGEEGEDAIVIAPSSRANAMEWYEDTEASRIPLSLIETFVDAVLERAGLAQEGPEPQAKLKI